MKRNAMLIMVCTHLMVALGVLMTTRSAMNGDITKRGKCRACSAADGAASSSPATAMVSDGLLRDSKPLGKRCNTFA